jgi:hypothetical protein
LRVFHIELRQFPHVARSFNLSEEELRATVLSPWLRGDVIELGERRWAPERARLAIYEGPRLRHDEIGMGRGWSNVTRAGTDVTEKLLHAARESEGGVAAWLSGFKEEVLAHCAEGRIGVHQVAWLANERYPRRRASERLELAEQAVWELLHERRLTMLSATAGDGEVSPVAQADWQELLLSWATWADSRAPSVLLERAQD